MKKPMNKPNLERTNKAEMETPDIKELFYEADTRKHQQWVGEQLIKSAKLLLDRAITHDESKFSEIERKSYVDPVWELNTRNVEYGCEEYKALTKRMGEGWQHHIAHNMHHPENVPLTSPEFAHDPFAGMTLFDLMEMLCDWIAASKRRGNAPNLPIERFRKDFGLSQQLECILNNTLGRMGDFT